MENTPSGQFLIQVALSDHRYAQELCERLRLASECEVRLVDWPDAGLLGVMVLDVDHMRRLGGRLRNPERVVLIAPNKPDCLAEAWEAGVNSVVLDKDPISTAVLAIMAAGLRKPKDPDWPPCTPGDRGMGPEPEGGNSGRR